MTINAINRHTPLDIDYATCDSTYVDLLIYIEGQDIQTVCDIMNVEATSIQNKGDKIKNSRGIERSAKSSYWRLSSENKVLSKDVRHHLDWLIEKLDKDKDNLIALQKNSGVSMFVYCNWWSSVGHGGPTIWPEQMKALAKLNLELSFDIYFNDDE
jgi:hypothetical protein